MIDSGASTARLDAFATCGASLWLQVSDDRKDMRLVCNCCHDRWCLPCATTRARRISANLVKHCTGRTVRFITLTLRHSDTPLADQIDRLYRSFKELRRRKFWQANVSGGAAFLEAKVSATDGRWHVHLHVIVEGRWLPQKELSLEWHSVTGDSSIVDVRPVKDLETATRYVAKYVTKPADASVWSKPDKLQEMVVATKGRRLCLAFGQWQKMQLTEIPDDGREWTNVGSLDKIILDASDGDPTAQRWFTAAARRWPHLPWPLLDLPPPECPGQLPLIEVERPT